MKRLWLFGFFLVVLAGVWVVMDIQWQDAPRRVGAGPDLGISFQFDNSAFALEMTDCRCCHGSVVNRHHLLAERKIYDCTHCHKITFSEATQSYEAQVVRDCLTVGCHLYTDSTLVNRHHITVEHGQQVCTDCHAVLLDKDTQSYFIDLARPCNEGVESSSISHYSAHSVTASDCDACHVRNLFEVHNQQCHFCHESTRPEVRAAISNLDTRCTTCHTRFPHSLKCEICHGLDRTYQPNQKSQVHIVHVDKVSCGVCHEIPETVKLEPTGQYCSICHVMPRAYSMDPRPMIHLRHIWKRAYFPYSCHMCHGQSVPQRDAKQCYPCHDDKTYQRGTLRQIHYEHNRRFDCSNCHYNPRLFDLSPVTPCFRCHEPRAYTSTFELHFAHQTRQCWSCHSAKDVSARAGFTCVDCHGVAKAYTSSKQVHQIHDSNGFQCWVCHSKVLPMYVTNCQLFSGGFNGGIEGLVTDETGAPVQGVTILANPGGFLAMTGADGSYSICVTADTLYSVAVYANSYEVPRVDVQVTGSETVKLDFALSTVATSGPDTDGDGLSDDFELKIGTDPTKQDTDGDGISDYNEVAYDGDPTTYSYDKGLDLNPMYIDSDGDGFVDGRDGYVRVADYPIGIDLDGDGYVDGEMDFGTNAMLSTSFYGDGDMNGDGKTDIADVLLIERMVLGLMMPTITDYVHGNTAPVGRPDGKIDMADVLMIQRKAMK